MDSWRERQLDPDPAGNGSGSGREWIRILAGNPAFSTTSYLQDVCCVSFLVPLPTRPVWFDGAGLGPLPTTLNLPLHIL